MEVAAALRQRLLDSLKRKREVMEDAEDGEILENEPSQSRQMQSEPMAPAEEVQTAVNATWNPPTNMPAWKTTAAFGAIPGISAPYHVVHTAPSSAVTTPMVGSPKLSTVAVDGKLRKLGSVKHAPLVIDFDSEASDDEAIAAKQLGSGSRETISKPQTTRFEADQKLKAVEAEIAKAIAAIKEKEQQAMGKASPGLQPLPEPDAEPSAMEEKRKSLTAAFGSDIAKAMLTIGQASEIQQRNRSNTRPQNGTRECLLKSTSRDNSPEASVAEMSLVARPASPDITAQLAADEAALQAIRHQQDENDRSIYMQQRSLAVLQSKDDALNLRRAELATEEVQAATQLATFKAQMEQLVREMQAFEAKAMGVSKQRADIDTVIEHSQLVQQDLKGKIESLLQKRKTLRDQVVAANKAIQETQALHGMGIAHIKPGRLSRPARSSPARSAKPQALATAAQEPSLPVDTSVRNGYSVNGSHAPKRRAKKADQKAEKGRELPLVRGTSSTDVYSSTPDHLAEETQKKHKEKVRQAELAARVDPRSTVSYASLVSQPPPRKLRKKDEITIEAAKAGKVEQKASLPDIVQAAQVLSPPATAPAVIALLSSAGTSSQPALANVPTTNTGQAAPIQHDPNDTQVRSLDRKRVSIDAIPQTSDSLNYKPIYVSPLHQFKSYKFHQEFSRTVPTSFRSISYFHKMKSDKPFCEAEGLGGACQEPTCTAQHFSKIVMTG